MATSLEVLTSGIWQLSSVVIADSGDCLVVDPGYFPRELEELGRVARARGRVVATAFTHGHWDHVVGWQTFPEAEVWGSPSLAQAIARNSARAQGDLARAKDFDGRWYVERPWPLRWPPRARALQDGERLSLGSLAIEALLLPGHSADGVALVLPERGVLVVGDYLSPCEIPFVEDVAAYQASLHRLSRVLDTVGEVIPGHGPRLTPARARQILEGDLAYLDELARHAARGDVAGALAMRWPRAEDVPGMREHHLENCAAVGLKSPA